MDNDNLRKVLIEIAYDNGMVNRNQTEDEAIEEMMGRLEDHYSSEDINRLRKAMNLLNGDEIRTVGVGEEDEVFSILGKHGIDDKYNSMLNVAFDG